MKEFDLGDIPPAHIYELMVEILKEASIDPYLRKQLHMELKEHGIVSTLPFSAELEAIQVLFPAARPQFISCSISSQEGSTILKIESYAIQQAFDAYIHEGNIKKLFGELRFRLESEGKPKLDEALHPDEMIINRFHQVEYEDVQFDSYITNSRLLLIRNNLVFLDIDTKWIHNLALQRMWNRKSIPLLMVGFIFLTIFGIMSLVLSVTGISANFLTYSIPIIIFLGFVPIIIGSASSNFYLLINYKDGPIQLYSKKAILRAINTLLNKIKTGKTSAINLPLATPQREEQKSIEYLSAIRETMKICPYCGTKNPSETDFCEKCGAAI